MLFRSRLLVSLFTYSPPMAAAPIVIDLTKEEDDIDVIDLVSNVSNDDTWYPLFQEPKTDEDNIGDEWYIRYHKRRKIDDDYDVHIITPPVK